MFVIPFAEYPAFTEDIILDESQFRLTFLWNDRGEFWTLTIADTNDNVLVSGIKIVLSYELICSFPGRSLPWGAFIAIDPSGTINRIGRNDFENESAFLVYATADEMQQIKEEL